MRALVSGSAPRGAETCLFPPMLLMKTRTITAFEETATLPHFAANARNFLVT